MHVRRLCCGWRRQRGEMEEHNAPSSGWRMLPSAASIVLCDPQEYFRPA